MCPAPLVMHAVLRGSCMLRTSPSAHKLFMTCSEQPVNVEAMFCMITADVECKLLAWLRQATSENTNPNKVLEPAIRLRSDEYTRS